MDPCPRFYVFCIVFENDTNYCTYIIFNLRMFRKVWIIVHFLFLLGIWKNKAYCTQIYVQSSHLKERYASLSPVLWFVFCIWETKWITIHRCSFNLRMFTKVWTALPRCFGVVIERRYTLLYPDIFVSGNGDATLAYSSFFLFTLAPSGSPTSWLVVPVFGDRVSGLPVSSPYFDYVIYSRSPLDTADWQSR